MYNYLYIIVLFFCIIYTICYDILVKFKINEKKADLSAIRGEGW